MSPKSITMPMLVELLGFDVDLDHAVVAVQVAALAVVVEQTVPVCELDDSW